MVKGLLTVTFYDNDGFAATEIKGLSDLETETKSSDRSREASYFQPFSKEPLFDFISSLNLTRVLQRRHTFEDSSHLFTC